MAGIHVAEKVGATPTSFENLVGSSEAMKRAYCAIRRVALTEATVLLYGESGTGKELAAEAIHALSGRSGGPLVKVNCAAFPEPLLESELFGHVKGAFTGAIADRIGCFEAASGGTLFLDEIGDIPHATQVRLLRVIEEKQIQRLGCGKTLSLDLRVVAATHKNLAEEVESGRFRADLFYRLGGVPVTLPPLRDRREDIPPLVHHFIRQYNQVNLPKIKGVASPAMKELVRRPWPGNVRELRNTIERAYIFCEGGLIQVSDLGPSSPSERWPFRGERRKSDRRSSALTLEFSSAHPLKISLPTTPKNALNAEALLRALEEHRWHIGLTARALGMHRTTLWRRMRKLELVRGD